MRFKNWLINYTGSYLGKFKRKRYTHLTEITFGMLILQNMYSTFNRESDSCCVLLVFVANIIGLSRWRKKWRYNHWCISKNFGRGFKVNMMWVDHGTELFIRFLKTWFHDNSIEMYSTHNQREFVVAERFKRNFINKIYRHMTVVSKMFTSIG